MITLTAVAADLSCFSLSLRERVGVRGPYGAKSPSWFKENLQIPTY